MSDNFSTIEPTSHSSFAELGAEDIAVALSAGARTDPALTVSQWADRYMVLSGGSSAEPGPYRTARTPYMRAIMDALSPSHPALRVVLMAGAQLGKTQAGLNWMGACIHHFRGPILAVQPTVQLAQRFSQQRVDPMIEESPALRAIVKPSRSRDSGNTTFAKRFPGGQLVLTGANSAVGLRSMPVRWLFLDEVDAYPGDVDGEGDPIGLAQARTRTFGHRRKIFIVSTPTVRGVSRIEREYEASDRRRYFVPCPHCEEKQWLKFERLKWPEGKPDEAAYICEFCGCEIEERFKTWMLENGEWRATAESGDPSVIGFHISGLYSPVGWLSWATIAREWLAAVASGDAAIKTAKNVLLGETWEERGEAPDAERLFARRANYAWRQIPDPALFLTAAADVQGDRLEYCVYAWDREFRSWLIDRGLIDGDPNRAEPWRALDEVVIRQYGDARGRSWGIDAFGVDTGFLSQAVYRWGRGYAGSNRVFLLDGRPGWRLPALGMPTKQDVDFEGRKIGTVLLWPVGTWSLKSELYSALGLLLKGPNEAGEHPPGTAFYGDGCDLKFFEQLTAEHLVRRVKNGLASLVWDAGGRRNEAHDTALYARALAHHIADGLTDADWSALEAKRRAPVEDAPRRVSRPPNDWLGDTSRWLG